MFCKVCLLTKDPDLFYRYKSGNCYSVCKNCLTSARKARYQANKEKEKTKNTEWVSRNRDKCCSKARKWQIANKDKVRKYKRAREKALYTLDFNFKIETLLRTRICSAVKSQGVRKQTKTIKLLGCSIQEFKTHIESKFDSLMNWNNYGKYGWHIDHIKPCTLFNLADPLEQAKCFNFKNLQPLWATTNLQKGAKYAEK